MKLEEIAAEAYKLPEEERASLASRLLHSLESPVYEVTDEEVAHRMREADEDPTVLITFDELVAGLKRGGSQIS
ncbi:MAG: addiction module protein [Verrucomicrobiae bacterium]|nr:addiction module protein [Verrucomicrobiae bacterium]